MATRSPLWDEFFIVNLGQEGVKPRAYCSHCSVASYIVDSSSGNTNMLNHLKKCKAYLAFKEKDTEVQQPFDQMVYRDLVAKAIIRHGYAFSWVKHEGNKNFHCYLNKQVRSICRNTAKSDCLALHRQLKLELKEILRCVLGRICLTSDMWTSCQTLGYMCLTAHYVDSTWTLKSKVLNFLHLETGHSGHDMYSEVIRLLQEWGIQHKIFSITLDNASSNEKMQDYLKEKLNRTNSLLLGGEFFFIRCAAHVLNLIVKDGLKVIDGCIQKIRESVKYVKWSEARKRNFNISVQNAGINESKALWLDLPSETEWELADQLRDLLEPLSDITDLFSGSDYPTANLYFENVWKIGMILKDLRKSNDLLLSKMAKDMTEKFDKYWFTSVGQEYNMLFAFALILDPRFKKGVLKQCFTRLYDDEKTGADKYNDVIFKLEKLFEEYAPPVSNESAQAPAASSASPSQNSTNAGLSTRKRKFQFADFVVDKPTQAAPIPILKSKLDLYLEDPLHIQDPDTPFNILHFWKENENKYGELSHLSRDVLTVPLTTVASESTFSIGGRVLDKWRSSLLPDNVEALITARSWLYGYAKGIIQITSVVTFSGTREPHVAYNELCWSLM
ncbi:hypothetical protein OROMI_019499 [Orobanche minor]